MDGLYKLCLLMTFLMVAPLIGAIIISLFKPLDPIRILVYCVVLVVFIHSNRAMKGG